MKTYVNQDGNLSYQYGYLKSSYSDNSTKDKNVKKLIYVVFSCVSMLVFLSTILLFDFVLGIGFGVYILSAFAVLLPFSLVSISLLVIKLKPRKR